MLYVVETDKTPDAVQEILFKAAEENNLGVINVIDLAEKMRDKGVEYDAETRIYELCNPKKAKAVLETNPAMSTALPCRISMYRENGILKLATIRPTAMIELYGQYGLEEVANEIEDSIKAVMDSAAS